MNLFKRKNISQTPALEVFKNTLFELLALEQIPEVFNLLNRGLKDESFRTSILVRYAAYRRIQKF